VSEEDALWAAIDAMPEDALRRLVLADFLDERAGVVACGQCKPQHPGRIYTGMDGMKWSDCNCDRGTVPDGRADLAMALRATAAYWPMTDGESWWWSWSLSRRPRPAMSSRVPELVWAKLRGTPDRHYPSWKDYSTASAAIRDLCLAYIAVHCKSELSS